MNLKQLLFLKASSSAPAELIQVIATGNPAMFNTNVQKPLDELYVPIKCYQTGSGTPSPDNIRPIVGYSGFNIYHLDKNEINFSATEATANGLSWKVTSTGNVTFEGTPSAYSGINVGIYYVKGGETIHGYLVGDIGNVKFVDAWIYDESWNHIGTASTGWSGQRTPQDQGVIDLSEYPDAAYVSITLSEYSDNVTMNGACYPVVGENLLTPDVYSITFSDQGTVYYGGYNVTTGVLSLTHAYRKFVGASDEAWLVNAEHQGFACLKWAEVKNKRVTMCNMSAANTYTADFPSYGWVYNQNSGYNIRTCLLQQDITAAQFKTWLQTHPLELVCPLINPITVQFTPVEINALVGNNIIWTNTIEDIGVKYLKTGEEVSFKYTIEAYVQPYGSDPYMRTYCVGTTDDARFTAGYETNQEYYKIQNNLSDGIDKYPILTNGAGKIAFVVPDYIRASAFFVTSTEKTAGYAKFIDGDVNSYDSSIPLGTRVIDVPAGADSFGFSLFYPNGSITDDIVSSVKVIRIY